MSDCGPVFLTGLVRVAELASAGTGQWPAVVTAPPAFLAGQFTRDTHDLAQPVQGSSRPAPVSHAASTRRS